MWVLIVWALIGGMALCGALCYGALAARYPDAGGGYVYLREAFGPHIAFLYGWKCFLVMDPGITAALAWGVASYVGFIVPLGPIALRVVAVSAIIALAGRAHRWRPPWHARPGDAGGAEAGAHRWPRVRRVRERGRQLAAISSRSPRADAGAPPFGPALAGALVAAFFSFGGWWEVTKIAGEVRDPMRSMPRALRLGLGIVTLVYVVTTLAFMYVIPIEQVGAGEAFVAQVGAVLLGPVGRHNRRGDRGGVRARQSRCHADAGPARLLCDGA